LEFVGIPTTRIAQFIAESSGVTTILPWFHVFRRRVAKAAGYGRRKYGRDDFVGLPTKMTRPSIENVGERILIAGVPVQPDMFFPKDTSLVLRVAVAAILGVVTLLVLVPCVVLFFAVSPESVSSHLGLFQLPVTCWAAWALVSLWAALDSSRLWRVLRWTLWVRRLCGVRYSAS
jgi:hypothetical protein